MMYKLLIVDDEPLIVDWLYRLFGGLTHLELDLYKAYTGEQAIGWLNRAKIDIVLTDIHMPEMDGMMLLENIKKSWPHCRVIFLTGYNHFEYVYTAIQHEGVSYLLKTEEDSVIVGAVEKAVKELDQSCSNAELMNKVRQQVGRALPLMQREYLTALLRGEKSVLPVTQQQLDEVEIPLQADSPLLVLLGRLDNVSKDLDQTEKNRLVYSVKNLVELYLFGSIHSAFAYFEDSYFIWLIQPADLQTARERMVLFVREMLETAQRACMESLQAGLSFVVAKESCVWEQVSGKYYSLKQLLNYRIGSKSGMILTAKEPGDGNRDAGAELYLKSGNGKALLNKIDQLESCLERGQKQEYFELFSEIAVPLSGFRDMQSIPALEIYFSLSLKLLSYINRWGLAAESSFHANLYKLTSVADFRSWDEAADYLRMISGDLFMLQEQEQEMQEKNTVMQLQQYIYDHIGEDISLVKLGELAHFNPAYLSRLFKQITGINITDYVQQVRLNKAKALLGESQMKIYEISAAVGLDSPAYFAKIFKKATNMTPQEYRESMART
ncbi:response regulator [Paenibacillus sp. GCM10027626]|uniref:response regulator transcription factor n=1 Tax=Paenibacillus sp. GCM10027626 TaxID=3273411 RepID=UPI003631EF47